MTYPQATLFKEKELFLPQKTDTKFSKIRSGMFIPDLDFFSIPDPGVIKTSGPG
jgi:hypothetical protein